MLYVLTLSCPARRSSDLRVMDDGFQNPGLKKDLSLLVSDAGDGLGNGRDMPAGPLRETPASGFARADSVVLIGDGPNAAVAAPLPPGPPLLPARLAPRGAGRGATDLAGSRAYAFPGFGRPSKFFPSLRRDRAGPSGLAAFASPTPNSPAT